MPDEEPAVRTAADNALFWKTVVDAVTVEYGRWRQKAEDEMLRAGSERQRVRVDGVDLGAISMSDGAWSVEMADREAFVKWVQDNHPFEMYAPPMTVRPAFMKKLIDEASKAGKTDVPGLRPVWKDGTITVRPNARAKERTRDLMAELLGEVGARGPVPALGEVDPAGDVGGGAGGVAGGDVPAGPPPNRPGATPPTVEYGELPWGVHVVDAPPL